MDPVLAQWILEDRKIVCAITDRDLNVIEVSGALNVWGPGTQSWLGCSLLDLVPELVGSEQALLDVLAGELPRFQLSWINRTIDDGQTAYLTMVELPYRDHDGRIVGLVHIVQDATETGRLEQRLTQHRNELRLVQEQLTRRNLELAAANAELERLDDLKSQFVSVAAHELRSPLTAIIGYLEMLLDQEFGPLTALQYEPLGIVQQSAQRLLSITNDLLDISRIEAGRIDLVLRPWDLSVLVRSVVAELKPQLDAKRQHLGLQAPAGLPLALCDDARVMQIARNLIGNAIKYTSHGGSIAVRVSRADEEGFLCLCVADDGIGIAAEDHARLFSRFFRAGSASLTQAPGAGLGLHIVRALVELHGGRIWFESALHQGSTFRVTFPTVDSLDDLGDPTAARDA